MVRIAWRMLRARPAAVLATFAALFFAAAVVTACGAMLESSLRYHGSSQRYAAAPVLVATTQVHVTTGSGDDRDTDSEPLTAHGALPAGLIATIDKAPGVRAAVGDRAVPATLATSAGATAIEVHPWSAATLTPFTLRSGVAPGPGQVVLDARLADVLGLRTGAPVRVLTGTGTRTMTLAGTATAANISVDTTVFTDDGTAAALDGGTGTLDMIGVFGAQGVTPHALAASVQRTLPSPVARGASPQVFTGSSRGLVESPVVGDDREFLIAVASVFGGMTLLIAILCITSTVGLSVSQRYRDIALLRAVAATPRQVRRMVVREAAMVALLAAGTGIWPGLWAATIMRSELVSRGLMPSDFRTHLSWLPPLVAAGSALLIAVVAAWFASIRASRIRPSAAVSESASPRRGIGVVRTLTGIVALAGGLVLAVVSASLPSDAAAGVSVATVFTFVLAVAMLGPLLIRLVAATIGRLLMLRSATGRLAAA
jgi:putative ABC transport system permease protein